MTSGMVVRPYDAVSSMLVKAEPALEKLLIPLGMNAARMIRVTQDLLIRDPIICECEPASIVRAVFQAAELGLEVGSPLGHAYIVSFWNGKKKRKEAKFISGYQGLITLAYDDPRIVGIRADIVREKDVFEPHGGTHPELIHKPDYFGDRGNVLGAYAAVQIKDGWPIYRVLKLSEIDAVKHAALEKMKEWSRTSSPWTKHEEEMQLKTALRRVLKIVPLSGRLRRALELDAAEYGEKPADPRGHVAELRTKLGATVEAVDAEILEEDSDD